MLLKVWNKWWECMYLVYIWLAGRVKEYLQLKLDMSIMPWVSISLLELENLCLMSTTVKFTYYLYMPRPQSMHIRMKQCLFTTDSLQLSMQSQHAIAFSYVVTSTQHCLSIKFVSNTDAVKLIVTLRCSNPLLSAMTFLLPMHTQGKNTAHFRPLMDQMGVRHSLIGFSVLFIMDVTSVNPIHLRHL